MLDILRRQITEEEDDHGGDKLGQIRPAARHVVVGRDRVAERFQCFQSQLGQGTRICIGALLGSYKGEEGTLVSDGLVVVFELKRGCAEIFGFACVYLLLRGRIDCRYLAFIIRILLRSIRALQCLNFCPGPFGQVHLTT